MLVLSRKPNEEILIGDNIRLMVVSIQGGQVKLGFVAPTEVPIYRSELIEGEPDSADSSRADDRRPLTNRLRRRPTALNGGRIG